jgi:gas vesicle protein
MRFIFGLITGIAIGAGAATAAASQSGQDIRGEFERIRADLEKRDFDAVGAHLEERFKDLQVSLEERFAEAGESPEEAAEDAQEVVDDLAEGVAEAVEEAEAEPATA